MRRSIVAGATALAVVATGLAVAAAGRASVHFDANSTDGDGSDIKGGSLGWTEKAY